MLITNEAILMNLTFVPGTKSSNSAPMVGMKRIQVSRWSVNKFINRPTHTEITSESMIKTATTVTPMAIAMYCCTLPVCCQCSNPPVARIVFARPSPAPLITGTSNL